MDVYLFIALGMTIGSFLNVVAYRVPLGIFWDSKWSRCPSCGHRLNVLELIPVGAYIIQKGKSRCCQKSMNIAYPLIELITGLFFGIVYQKYGLSMKGIMSLGWGVFVILLAATDLFHLKLPNNFMILLLVWSLITVSVSQWHMGPSLQCMLLVGGSCWLLYPMISSMIGGGDLKYLTVLAFGFGWYDWILIIFIASFVALCVVLISKFFKKNRSSSLIPFGFYLSVAALTIFLQTF